MICFTPPTPEVTKNGMPSCCAASHIAAQTTSREATAGVHASATAAYHNPYLLVSARFESTLTTAVASSGDVVTALAPGTMVALPANAMTGPNVTESDWISASKASYAYQQQLPENTLLYELNDRRSPMWYYSYESGSTKTQREMKHVLARFASNCSERKFTPYWWTLIRFRHNKGSGSGQQRMTGTDGCVINVIKLEEKEVPLGYRSPSLVQWGKQGGLRRVTSGINEDAAEDEAKHVAPMQSQGYARSESPVGEPSQFCCLCQERLTLQTHSPQLQALDLVKQLLLLRLFVFATPLEAFSFYFNEIDSGIRSEWLFNIPPIRREQSWVDDPADHTAIAEMKLTLTLADFVGDEETVKSSTSKLERAVLQYCADLLLSAFSSPRIQDISVSITSNGRHLRRVGRDEAITRSELCGQFSQMITEIYDELTQLLTTGIHDANPFGFGQFKTYASVPELVDDILSVIYSERRYEVLRGEVTALLLHRGDLFEAIIQEVFRGFVAQTRTTPCMNTGESCGAISAASRAASGWSRRWFVDPMSLLVVPIYLEISSVDTGSYPPRSGKASLLLTLTLIRMLASVDMVLDGRRLTIEAAMSEVSLQLPGLSGTVLELDGDTHAFKALPSGLQSAAGAGAAVFGGLWDVKAYKGLAADSGMSLDVSLLMLSNIQANSRRNDLLLADSDVVVRKTHVTLVLNDTRDGCGDHLDVRAEVFELRLPSHQVASWQSSKLFDYFLDITSEVKWSPTVEIAVTYVPVPRNRGGVS
ncbi:hypothetical protein PF008_g14750 [Phytophthora fragariae]|uniref:Uncharacterized protein n=2 Tax=Phytophthora fragariae TaxID=53985 RepID=A0A6G0RGK8_9STRA|nr:hypothetical protein PF008_g14750 [Phytophthora fragariae]